MKRSVDGLLEDAGVLAERFRELSVDLKRKYQDLVMELDECGREIEKGIKNVREVNKFFEDFYDV